MDYICPFDKDKCVYCLKTTIDLRDEFRPSSQRGRYNIVNCLPCCGYCNSSKQDKCGSSLIKWIKDNNPTSNRLPINIEQQEKIINWYKENEKYLLIPENIIDSKDNKTYGDKLKNLDSELNEIYEKFS